LKLTSDKAVGARLLQTISVGMAMMYVEVAVR
jgi:hypothetical protein